MKIIFEIPDEFIKDWKKDRFKDSLQRLSVDAHCLAGLYDQEVAIMLINEFKKAVEVEYGKWVPDDRKITVHCSDVRPVVYGEWKRSGRWGRVYGCSACGNILDFDGVNAGRGDANFCPNCGAQMEVEE